MCTNYEASLYRVLTSFDQNSPNTISNVIDETQEDVLFLDNVRLSEFISLLSHYGYLQQGKTDDSFLLTAKGLKKEEFLKDIVGKTSQENVLTYG